MSFTGIGKLLKDFVINTLTTNNKTIPGAINELNGNLQNKQNNLAKQTTIKDINYIMDAGWYWIDPGTVSNTPGHYWGSLEVINSGAVTQRFTTYPNNYTISRIYANGSWTDWRYPNGDIFT